LVEKVLGESRPKNTLDVGCNTGFFAAIAAKHGDVVGIDVDAAVVGATWERADRDRLPILSLVVDISRPTPALGWRNSEQSSFLDRATGAFDAVLMLAVLHHLLITERVPLDEILGLAARVSRSTLVVEWIPPEDPQFRRVARGRDHLFSGLTRSRFEEACSPFFSRVHAEAIGESGRWLYVLRRRARG
jgi:ribosomal protein L11 methylase PrmA